ncbi:hypothetical protein AL755_19230 [Arthrobacter sp. ERGS1:01]|uniref:hypothetical protein n=1 Tax=Arthrobacter sp. ERGS1:01 TaxID=1704044 RepID=UPI0006B452D2|nr:hypothetical protein [Arthrobacter sp. ERGS1:01]ALE07106.1 hypothetical protein AL755_19230 [Arthrobacter sp. ERGS1:01]
MTWGNEPTLAQLAAHERRQRRVYPRNPRHKVTFGIGAFAIGALVWVVVFPVPAMVFMVSDPTFGDGFDGGLAVIGAPIGLAIEFGIPSAATILVAGLLLVRVRRQWIHVVVIAGVSGLTPLLLLLALLPFTSEHAFVFAGVPLTAAVAAALGRVAATPLVCVAP